MKISAAKFAAAEARQRVRVQQNPITGEIERTVLDAVQLAFESAREFIRNRCASLPDWASQYRLKEKLLAYLLEARLATAGLVVPEQEALQRLVVDQERLIWGLCEKLAVCAAELSRCAERREGT